MLPCVNDTLLYETILLNIRTETIAYSIHRKKQRRRDEQKNIEEISKLENRCSEQPALLHAEELSIKYKELEEVRKPLIDGLIVRSRANWYQMAERPSQFLLNLAKRNYTSKIIPA